MPVTRPVPAGPRPRRDAGLARAFVVALALLAAVRGAPSTGAAAPRRHALLVACGEYPFLRRALGDEVYRRRVRLEGPANDAALWRDLLTRLGTDAADVTVLSGWSDADPDANPSRRGILRELVRLARRVRPGDQAFVLLCGHGTRVPDASGDEPDGFDEVFLPADVTRWDGDRREVPGAISDDELGERLRAIRDAGATVVLVADCCHAGTLLRGGDGGVRWRSLRPDLLGIPAVAPRRGGPATDARAVLGGDPRGIVALYAAGSDERAPEQPLPRGEPGARWHGLLSYAVASELARAPSGATWREVATGCAAAYRALPCHGASPLAEGDLDRPARLGEARVTADPSLVAVRRDGERLVAAAGALAGLVPGVVLEETTSGAPGARPRRLRVVTSDAFAAVLEPATPADAAPVPTGPGAMPALRVVERPAPDLRLPLASVDAEGRSLDASALPDDLAAALRAPDVAARFPRVAGAADAAWLLVRGTDGTFGLRPSILAGGDDAPFPADAASLSGTLAQVFRVENLRRLASTGVAPAPDPALHVDLARVGETATPTRNEGLALVPGDRVRITIRNETGRAWDLWLFALDASYGVSCVFPAPGDAPRLTAEDRGPISVEATVTDDTLGEEHLLVVAVPPVAGALPAELRWLEAPPLARRAIVGARGPAGGGALGVLLEETAFGGGLVAGRTARRGVASDAAAGALALRTWRTAWPTARAPASFPATTEDLAASPPPPPPAPPASPAPSDLPDLRPAGRRACLVRSGPASRAPDVLVVGDDRPREVRFLLAAPPADGPAPTPATFRARAAFRFEEGRRVALYDTDDDGAFDLVLVDRDDDPEADDRFVRRGDGWRADRDVNVPWLRAAYCATIPAGEARERAVAALRFLTR